MMKRIFFAMATAAAVVMMFSSCEKEPVGPRGTIEFESTNTVWAEFTVTNDMWVPDPATQDLCCSLQWDVLTGDILKCGNIQAYLYEGVRQVPLPYVYPVEFPTSDTTMEIRPLNIRFDVEEGIITFIVTDCGEYLTDPRDLYTMRFRAVCTYPVNYHIYYKKNQDKQ